MSAYPDMQYEALIRSLITRFGPLPERVLLDLIPYEKRAKDRGVNAVETQKLHVIETISSMVNDKRLEYIPDRAKTEGLLSLPMPLYYSAPGSVERLNAVEAMIFYLKNNHYTKEEITKNAAVRIYDPESSMFQLAFVNGMRNTAYYVASFTHSTNAPNRAKMYIMDAFAKNIITQREADWKDMQAQIKKERASAEEQQKRYDEYLRGYPKVKIITVLDNLHDLDYCVALSLPHIAMSVIRKGTAPENLDDAPEIAVEKNLPARKAARS